LLSVGLCRHANDQSKFFGGTDDVKKKDIFAGQWAVKKWMKFTLIIHGREEARLNSLSPAYSGSFIKNIINTIHVRVY
jgi:hypothetical protein